LKYDPACFWFPGLETVSVFWKPKEADVLKILSTIKIIKKKEGFQQQN
jgi:hypothetical protein